MRLFLVLLLSHACVVLCLFSDGRASERLNILLVTADDLGMQLSCYGDPHIETPSLDAFAASGVRFETAWVTQASCSPSRSSMLSGLYPHGTGQIGLANGGFRLFPSEVGRNLPAYLKEAGYRTGIMGKLHVAPESSFPFDFRPRGLHTRDVRKVAEEAGVFLRREGGPFFLMVNFSDPHFYKEGPNGKPVFPPQWKGIPRDLLPEDAVPGWDFQGFDEPVARRRVSNYYSTVKRLDTGVGLLLSELESAGRRDDTLVIFVSDHGPPFNRGKTTCYEAGLRVPFLVRWPGVSQAGLASGALVSTVDLTPTILDAAGVAFPGEFHGKSLRPLLSRPEIPQDWRTHLAGEFHYHGPGAFFPRRAIRDARFKLIHNPLAGQSRPPSRVDADPTGQFAEEPRYRDTVAAAAHRRFIDPPEWELYDLEKDPVEFHNLADDLSHAGIRSELERALLDWREETGDPLLEEQGRVRFERLGVEAATRAGR